MGQPDEDKTKEDLIGAEAAESLASLTELDEKLENLDSQNRELYNEVKGRYDAVLEAITAKLREPDNADKKNIITLRKEVAARQASFLKRFPEFQAEEKDAEEAAKLEKKAERLFAILDSKKQIPKGEAEQFKIYCNRLPIQLKASYLNLLKGALKKSKDPVSVLTHFRGALFELSRRDILEQQGLEELGDYNDLIVVNYLGYDRSQPGNFDRPPNKSLGGDERGDIQLDVHGVLRDGKPFIYETKSATRKLYGGEHGNSESVSSRNQLLKYQKAIEDGQVSGATVEVRGRIDYDFLVWCVGADITSEGAVPDVEIIYNLLLPSGREFRFVLKKGANGLQFENKRSDYSVDDKIVIRGLAQAVRDKSITSILQDVNVPTDVDHPLVTAEHIANPPGIRELDVYHAYHDMRMRNIWEQLEDKAIDPDEADKVSSYDERVTHQFVMDMLTSYQLLLDENPELKAQKWAYVIEPERYEEAVGKTMDEVGEIRDYELTRDGSREEKRSKVVRDIKGYQGPKEGYPLDVEHILMDVLQNINKTGEDQKPRSYDDVDRFIKLTELKEHLEDADRTFVEVKVFDPKTDAYNSTIITGDKSKRREELLAGLEKDTALENLRRAEDRLNRLLKRYQQLHEMSKGDASLDEQLAAEYSSLQSALSRYHLGGRNKLDSAKAELEALEAEKKSTLAPLQATMKNIRARIKAEGPQIKGEIVGAMRSASASFLPRIDEKKKALMEVYKDHIFQSEWNDFAKREVSREDANFMKLIYVITPEGEVILEEERIRGASDSSRAAHSELAQGRNTYAAGELGFERDDDGQWKLTVINNGSGHYRPSQDTLSYARQIITEQLGLEADDPSIELRNCIFRGIDIDGLPLGFK